MSDFATKQEQAYSTIREWIVTGRYAPGARVTLRDLANQLHMSEIPIREAIRRLELEGLIVSVPHTGLTIAPLSESLMKDTLEIRNVLEPLAAQFAASRISDEEIEALGTIVAAMEEAAAENRSERYSELNREFHSVIYRAARNPHLYAEIFLLWDHFDRYHRIVFGRRPGHMRRSLREHLTIYETLQNRDPEAAFHAMAVHRRNATRGVRDIEGAEKGEEPAAEAAAE